MADGRNWLQKEYSGLGTLELVLIIVVLVALVLMFKETIVDFVAGILDGIESQGGTFNPTSIVK
ncbi:MAG: hypothetical protein IJM90_09005 [Firmicutes bacterium]|nr:hypothetical protein [Bacillota bacterium]